MNPQPALCDNSPITMPTQLEGIPTGHRSYPPPRELWVIHQTWRDLFFAPWPVPWLSAFALPDCPPLLHFARRLDVVVWGLARL